MGNRAIRTRYSSGSITATDGKDPVCKKRSVRIGYYHGYDAQENHRQASLAFIDKHMNREGADSLYEENSTVCVLTGDQMVFESDYYWTWDWIDAKPDNLEEG